MFKIVIASHPAGPSFESDLMDDTAEAYETYANWAQTLPGKVGIFLYHGEEVKLCRKAPGWNKALKEIAAAANAG